MLWNYSAMFTVICMLGSFVAVYCQAPVALNLPFSSSQAGSSSGLGSSSANVAAIGSSQLYSGVGTEVNSGSAVGSSAPDPNVRLFAHSLSQLLLTSPVLNSIPGLVITDPYSTIKKAADMFLEKESKLNLNKSNLAEFVAERSSDMGVITINLLLNTVAHVIPRLLSFNNLLTQRSTSSYPRIVVNFMEAYGIRDGIFDADSLVQALANGFLDFVEFLGINNKPTIYLTFQLYVKELKWLGTGVEM